MAFTRRGLLGAGLAAAALGRLPVPSLIAKTAQTEGDAAESKLFLFIDWFHVQKGELKVSLDPAPP